MIYQAISPGRIYIGYDAIVALTTDDTGGGFVLIPSISIPAPLMGELMCYRGLDVGQSGGAGKPYYDGTGTPLSNAGHGWPIWLHLQCPAGSAPGLVVVSVVLVSDGVRQEFAVPLEIVAAPVSGSTPERPHHPAVAIPGYGVWLDTASRLANKWSDPQMVCSFGLEGQCWYYDGPRVFWEIGEYLKTNKYDATALNIAKQYAQYVNAAGGQIPGWRIFPHGLRMAYERTGDPIYKDALMALSRAPWVSTGGDAGAGLIRETAYSLETWLEVAKLGDRSPLIERAAGFLLGHIDQLCRQEQGRESDNPPHQPFWDGLAMEALIQYHELTGDPRVIDAVQTCCDYIWNRGVDPATGMVTYDLWRPDGVGGNAPAYTSLNLLMAPAWSWLFWRTGVEKFRTQGDVLFTNFNREDLGFSGKVFAQNYRWSTNYVYWRRMSEYREERIGVHLSLPDGWTQTADGSVLTPSGEHLRFTLEIS